MRLWAAWLALLACSSAKGNPEHDVINEIERNGGEVHFTIGKPCSSCERGALASRAFSPGDVIARLPAGSTLAAGTGTVAEEAFKLLTRIHTDPEINQTFPAFLRYLPGLGDMLAPASLAPAELAEVQMPELERLVMGQQRELKAVFSKHAEGAAWLTLQQLHHWTALLRTRSFSSLLGARRLVPAIDMLNHHEEHNAEVKGEAGAVLLKAVQPIAQGEELLLHYKARVLHRDDAALFLYGFLPQEHSPPLLCALDLPTYSAVSPWRRTDASDDWHVPTTAGGWLPDLQLLTEYGRLADLLASLPTTEEQDKLLMASEKLPGSWKPRVLVAFRLRRKRALRHALERMEAAWAAAHPTAAGLRALCGPGGEAQQAAGGTGGRCSGGAALLAVQENPGSLVAALPCALLQPLSVVVLAALQLRRPSVLLGRLDVLVLLASAAALVFLTRRRVGGGCIV